MYETLIYEQNDHVVTLTCNRPDQHNAISREMNQDLHHAWQCFRDDAAAFVLVITGAGETTFGAGWDLKDASELTELQGAIRSDKETVLCGAGRTLEERLRIEAEMVISMFMRRDKHTRGAAAFKHGNLEPDWPHHGL